MFFWANLTRRVVWMVTFWVVNGLFLANPLDQ